MDVRKMIKKTFILAAFAMLLTVTVSAKATCVQADINGVWHDFTSSSTAGAVGKCIFRFGSNGAINGSSVCYNFTKTANIPPINITSGAFKVNASCNITGSIAANNGVNAWFIGQMDKSKNSFSGISRNNTGSIAFHNFVKQ